MASNVFVSDTADNEAHSRTYNDIQKLEQSSDNEAESSYKETPSSIANKAIQREYLKDSYKPVVSNPSHHKKPITHKHPSPNLLTPFCIFIAKTKKTKII